MNKQFLRPPFGLVILFSILFVCRPQYVPAHQATGSLSVDGAAAYLSLNRDLRAVARAGACSAHLPGWERLFAPPVINSVSATSPTDCGVSDGTLFVDATGDSPLEYSVNFGGSWQPDPNFSGLPAGDYTVLVRNIGETTEVAYVNNPVELRDPAAPTIFGVTQTDPTSCTNADGIISVGALPGVGTPEYSVDEGQTWQSSGSFPNLASGNYWVYARNGDGTCVTPHTNNPIQLFATAAPGIQSVTTTATSDCGVDDGEIVIVGTGGGPLQYSIDGGTNWRAVNTFDDLPQGDYEVAIRNDDGTCTVPYFDNPVRVDGPVTPVFVDVRASDISDCAATDGSIEIHTEPGVGFVEYSINNGTDWSVDSSFTGLLPNTYNVRVRYLDGSCELEYRSNPITFTDPAAPVIVAIDSIDPTGCGGANGEISFLATGDRDLLYSINGGTDFQSNPVFSNLSEGSYDPLVAYAGGGCTATSPSITLSNDAGATFILSALDATACFDAAGAYALAANNIRVDGAAVGAGYTVSYSSTEGSFANNTNPNTNFFPNTNAVGTYTIDVMVTELASACSSTTSFDLTISERPAVNLQPDSICLGGSTSLSSGSPGVHNWSVLSGDVNSLSCTNCPSPTASPNQTTVYGLSLVNPFLSSCETIDSVEIFIRPEPQVLNPISDYSLCSGNTLTISLELSEPIAGYTVVSFDRYENATVMGNVLTLDVILDGASANYRVDFVGDSGCETSHGFSVSRIADPVADFTYAAPTCAESDIVFQFIGTAGGNANLSWDLDGGDLLFSSPVMGSNPAGSEITASWDVLGTYSIILTVEEGGCTARDTQDITINATAPQLSATVTLAASCGTSPGAIDLTATGADNIFNWSGPMGYVSEVEDPGNLAAGFYSVTVTDTITTCNTIEVIEVGEDGLFNCTDNIRVLIPAVDPFPLCLDDVVNLPAPIISATVCGENPAEVTVSVEATSDCITLDPNDSFVGESTVCVFHCDGNAPQNCDTTFLTVMVSPPTDTVRVNILGDIASEVCIDAAALQIGTSITSSTFCGTGNSATVQATAVDEECVVLNAAPGFLGLSPDLICVINCYDNFALFCDTTYIEVTVDPNNCTDPIVEESLTLPVADCNMMTPVCLSLPFSSVGDYDIFDNGVPYAGVPAACGTDSTELALSQGGHLLIFRERATGCPDTVLVDLDNGLDLYTGETDFEVACDSILRFCLDIPFAEAADYQITANGMALPTDGCGLDSFYVYDYSQIPDQGAIGPYLLQSWTVNGSVFIGNFNNIPELVDSMNVWDPAGNWSDDPAGLRIVGGSFFNVYGNTMEVRKVTGGSGSLVLGIDYRPSNIAIELDAGEHEVILTYLPTNCFDRVNFTINCSTDPECQDIFTSNGPLNLNVADCADLATFCTGIDAADLADYNFFDNGNAYTGDFPGCNEQTILRYPFAAIPGQGNTGPYAVTSWSVGIDIYSGVTFGTLSELVDAMNAWDPAGNWVLNGTSIEGGSPNSGYGALQIEFNTDNYPIFPMPLVLASSFAVELDTGFHQLIVEFIPTGCRDTIDIDVNCVACSDFILVESTTLNSSDCTQPTTYCVSIPFATIGDYSITDNNFPYLGGTVECPGSAGAATQLNLDRGIHELVFTERSTGCSDTVEVIVNCVTSSTQEIELLLNTLDTLCADNTELLGAIISNTNICEDASGEMAVFTAVPGTFCYEVQGVEVGTDTACIVLCDANICDTTYLIVNVVEELTPEGLPVAVADATTTIAGQAISYDVLANDTINGTLDTFQILNQPDNGFAWYDSTGTIHYQPDAEFCDLANPEMIAYEICNENGCDTSELLITVICDDLKTFSGFSPNGDGKNDTFIIQGAEAYPNNRLLIFSRWGTLIFRVDGYTNDWDGTWEGDALPEGTYFYLFDTGAGQTRSGYLQIHR
ncbi:MAG: gliding motility-associated C-terminal domain-containing protein [Bacteroidota bacterium]